MKKILILLLISLAIGCKNPEVLPPSGYKSTAVKNAYEASCGIRTIPTAPFEIDGSRIGSGVILNSGYVLSNKHIVDTNGSGEIDPWEKDVVVSVFHPDEAFYRGKVIGPFVLGYDYDLVVIKVDGGTGLAGVELISDEDYSSIGLGERLFAIGQTYGLSPPHYTEGVRSTDTYSAYHRAAIPTYYGNSGGGLFRSSTGQLVGINTRLQADNLRSLIVPSWTEYIPANRIREILKANDMDYVLVKKSFGERGDVSTLSTFYTGVICGGIFFIAVGIKRYISL